VTGILPVALENATKTVQALLLSGKEYVCVMKLHGDASEQRVREVLKEFEGKIYQRPPLRASVKRRLRTRTVYYIDFLEMEGRNVLFKVGCEAGTYIRKLCYDVGEVLGCGAHMQELRRTRAGPFVEEEDLVTLHEVAYYFEKWRETGDESHIRRFILPMEKALELLPKIYIRDSAVDAVCHGASLTAPGVVAFEDSVAPNHTVAVLTLKGEAVALAKALVSASQLAEMDHGFVAKTHRVLMERGVYPKAWTKTQTL